MSRGGEQPAQPSRAVHAEECHAAAGSGHPCMDQEPDLELGRLPDQNANSASALHTNEADQSTLNASRSVILFCPQSHHPVLCAADDSV